MVRPSEAECKNHRVKDRFRPIENRMNRRHMNISNVPN